MRPFRIVAVLFALAASGAGWAQEPAPAPAGEKTKVVLIGDSLAEGVAPSLTEALGDVDSVEIVRRVRANSGLVREESYDWRAVAREIVAEGKIGGAVVLIGTNDRQALQTESGRLPPLSEAWLKEYQTRVDDVIRIFAQSGTKVYWVGLPPMSSPRVSSDMAAFNEIFRERAAAAGAKFIDVWDGFANDNGRFAPTGPDLTGAIRRLRAGDGVHFSRAGYDKLAHFIEQEIRADLTSGSASAAPEAEQSVEAPVEAPAEPPPQERTAAAPAPPPAAKRPPPGLTSPLTGGGEGALIAAGPRRRETASSLVPPKPGRADDVMWPK